MRRIYEAGKALPLSAIMVFTPGQPMQTITGTGNGYMVSESGKGVTQVLDLGGVTLISRPTGPTTFILNDAPVGGIQPNIPVLPALPTSPVQPNGLDLLVPVPPGLPTGPNNEYDF